LQIIAEGSNNSAFKANIFVAVASGVIGACAYLIKLSYAYIMVGIMVGLIVSYLIYRQSFIRFLFIVIGSGLSAVIIVLFIGNYLIGIESFTTLIDFHKAIFTHSGLYGTGKEAFLS
jgi:hypothetical protein